MPVPSVWRNSKSSAFGFVPFKKLFFVLSKDDEEVEDKKEAEEEEVDEEEEEDELEEEAEDELEEEAENEEEVKDEKEDVEDEITEGSGEILGEEELFNEECGRHDEISTCEAALLLEILPSLKEISGGQSKMLQGGERHMQLSGEKTGERVFEVPSCSVVVVLEVLLAGGEGNGELVVGEAGILM